MAKNKNSHKSVKSNSRLYFKNNKNALKSIRSQSEVITTVLLILLVIVAIVIVWNVVLPMINKAREGTDTGLITTNLAINSVKLYLTGGADIQVKRLAGEGNITALKFIFYKKNGDSSQVAKEKVSLNELDTKTFSFIADELKFNNGDIASVSVVPMLGKNNGGEIKETETQIRKDISGNRILDTPAGIMSWWKFDGNPTDSVGGNSGTCTTDCPTTTADNKGNADMAYSFDGATQYIDLGNSAGMQGNAPFTISAWVNSNGAGTQGIISRGTLSNSVREYFLSFTGGNTFSFQRNDGVIFNSLSTPSNKQINVWYNVVAWYDGSNMKIFVNGNEEGNLPSLISVTGTNQLDIGDVPESSRNYFFNGKIDNVMMYNRALSANEISALYNNLKT